MSAARAIEPGSGMNAGEVVTMDWHTTPVLPKNVVVSNL